MCLPRCVTRSNKQLERDGCRPRIRGSHPYGLTSCDALYKLRACLQRPQDKTSSKLRATCVDVAGELSGISAPNSCHGIAICGITGVPNFGR